MKERAQPTLCFLEQPAGIPATGALGAVWRKPPLPTPGRPARVGLNVASVYGNFGGIGNYALQLARHLPAVEPDVEWVFFGPDRALVPELTRENAKVIVAGKSGVAKLLWEQTVLPAAARRNKIELLHGADFSRPIVYAGPTANTIHDITPFANPGFFPLWKRAYKQALISMAARRSAAIITVSEFSRQAILDRFPFLNERVFVIYHGVETAPTNGAGPHRSERPFLLFVGGLENRKNLVPLIRAFSVLRERRRIPHRLILAGNPGYGGEAIRAAIRENGADDSTDVRGYVSREELAELYRSASLLVYPSVYEGFGFPVLEAMAYGTPVVCSNATSLPEVGGDAAIYFDPQRVEEMAAAIERVLDSPSLQAEMSEKGLKRAAKFTWEDCARKHVEVYRKILAQ